MLIGFGHRFRVGKDTAADYLIKQYGFKRLAFADALKKVCIAAFGFTEEQVYGSKKMEVDPYWGKSPGHYLQQVGTELFRNNIDPNFWVKAAFRQIDADPDSNYVIPDLRFKNEAQAILDRGGYVVRIDRPGASDPNRNSLHPSEVDLLDYDKWSRILHNDGPIEKLYLELDWLHLQCRERRL